METVSNKESLTQITGWIERAVATGASDLHLIPGYPAVMRLHGELSELDSHVIGSDLIERLIAEFGPPNLAERFRVEKSADFSFELSRGESVNRFRVNVF